MSSTATSIPPYVFEQQGTFDAPFTYTVPGTLEIRPDTATATFDGSGAGGDFLACLTFYSPEGSRLCRMFNPTPVTAGDVAEVTYIPPFGSAAASSAVSSGGLQFDSGTYGPHNVGDWLDVETTADPGTGTGLYSVKYHQDATGSLSAFRMAGFVAAAEQTGQETIALVGDASADQTGLAGTSPDTIGVVGSGGQDGGGIAVGVNGTANVSGLDHNSNPGFAYAFDAHPVATDGGQAYGLRTPQPIGFTDVTGSFNGIAGKIFLRKDGGGVFTLVASVGATSVDLVSGTP